MPNPFQKTSPRRVNRQAFDAQVWELRKQGFVYNDIAAKIGDGTTVFDVSESMRRQVKERDAEIRDAAIEGGLIELEHLDAMKRQIAPYATGGVVTDAQGRPVVDENGNPTHHPPNLKAIGTALAIHDRKVKLLGLDKVRIEVSGTGGGSAMTGGGADLSRLSPQEVAILEHLHRKALALPEPSAAASAKAPAGEP